MASAPLEVDEAAKGKARVSPWILLGGILLFFVLVIVVLRGVADYVTTLSLEPYRSLGAGEVLTEYMQSNNGRWPGNWSDIEAFMGPRNFMGIGTYADFRKFIDVDFQFDPQAVDLKHEEYGNPSFDVVKLRSGRVVVERNANQVIQAYLLRNSR